MKERSSRTVRSGLVLAALVLLAAVTTAQPMPGDFVLASPQGVLMVDRARNKLQTIAAFNCVNMVLAWGNDSMRALRLNQTTTDFVDVTPGGTVTPLATLPIDSPVQGLMLDQDGAYIVGGGKDTSHALYRVDGSTVSTLLTLAGTVQSLTLDDDSGDYLVGLAIGLSGKAIVRVDRETLQLTTVNSQFNLGLEHDQNSGHFWISTDSHIVRLMDRDTGNIVQSIPGLNALQVTVDEETTDLYAVPAANSLIWHYTAGGTVLENWGPFPGVQFFRLQIWGARKLSGQGDGAPDSRYVVRLKFPESAGAAYCGALSLGGLRPGIPVGPWIIHAAPDALFLLSACGALPGITTGFLGSLDNSGGASASFVVVSILPSGTMLTFTALAVNANKASSLDVAASVTVRAK